MGLDMDSDFEKYCKVVETPKLGRLSHRHSLKSRERGKEGKTTNLSSRLSMGGNVRKIDFNKTLSSSCKGMSSGPPTVSAKEAFKRGSVYQSSSEVRRIKTMGAFEVREKIELSHRNRNDTSLLDSLCQPDEANPLVEKKLVPSSSDVKLNPEYITFVKSEISPSLPSGPRVSTEDVLSSGLFEISIDSKDREQCSVADIISRDSTGQTKNRCNQTNNPLDDGNGLLERDTTFSLHKSSSEKLGMAPCRLESDQYSKANSKSRFSHFRRMFDPFMKSKSLRSPTFSVQPSEEAATIKTSKTVCKSLLRDFSDTTEDIVSAVQSVEPHHSLVSVPYSPAHLHGLIKLELKHGEAFFKFSLKDPEDFLVAKTWKADNALNWVYTFHTVNSRRRSHNRSPWGAKEKKEDDSMVGQMQVSSYLCSEFRENGAFDNSMVTEFVLYDVAHARKSFQDQESSKCSTDSTKHVARGTSCESQNLVVGDLPFMSKDSPNDPVNHKLESTHLSNDNDDFGVTSSYPWTPADLHPNIEIMSIVVQVPFEKRESLKDKQEDKVGVNCSPNLLDTSGLHKKNNDIPIPSKKSLANVKVVIPSGTHGLPTTEEDSCGSGGGGGDGGGPSSLLDRWRSSGGCDCGGWDMACPLLVLDSPSVQSIHGGHPLIENRRPLELFVQGAKEKIPALTIKVVADGQYTVDFHAQLSRLQAFSICVALLHSSEISTTAVVGQQQKETKRLQCNSLKVLLEEEVRFLIGAVTEGQKRKMTKKLEDNTQSFLLNPPFSPISRV